MAKKRKSQVEDDIASWSSSLGCLLYQVVDSEEDLFEIVEVLVAAGADLNWETPDQYGFRTLQKGTRGSSVES